MSLDGKQTLKRDVHFWVTVHPIILSDVKIEKKQELSKLKIGEYFMLDIPDSKEIYMVFEHWDIDERKPNKVHSVQIELKDEALTNISMTKRDSDLEVTKVNFDFLIKDAEIETKNT